MRMSYGIIYNKEGLPEGGMEGETLKELLKEKTQLKKSGKGGQIIILDRCMCGCGCAHPDKNEKIINF